MIRFPCPCGFQFEVPDDACGTSLQCPQCKLLVDVPALDDLAHLESDGTIRLEPESVQEKANRDAELMRVYRPQRQDDNGNDYDLRNTFEDILKAGVDERPLELKDELHPGPPKYDPVTGELIRPMALKGDEYPHVLPLPAQPSRTLN